MGYVFFVRSMACDIWVSVIELLFCNSEISRISFSFSCFPSSLKDTNRIWIERNTTISKKISGDFKTHQELKSNTLRRHSSAPGKILYANPAIVSHVCSYEHPAPWPCRKMQYYSWRSWRSTCSPHLTSRSPSMVYLKARRFVQVVANVTRRLLLRSRDQTLASNMNLDLPPKVYTWLCGLFASMFSLPAIYFLVQAYSRVVAAQV